MVGSIPYAGGTQRLASRIGAGRAAEMVLTAAILPPGPAVMLSEDAQEGIASLQRYGPGHANFNNR